METGMYLEEKDKFNDIHIKKKTTYILIRISDFIVFLIPGEYLCLCLATAGSLQEQCIEVYPNTIY